MLREKKFCLYYQYCFFFTFLLIVFLRKLFFLIPFGKKIVLDYEKKFSYKSFEIFSYEKFFYIKFYKNLLKSFPLKKIIRNNNEIYITKRFKNSVLQPVFEKYYKNYDICFEDCIFKNLQVILKSINPKIENICICFRKTNGDYEKLKKVTDICTHFTDKIFISTDDIIVFDKLNSLILEKTGVGLLYKNVQTINDSDVIIILNERLCDFSGKARFVINLQKKHYVYGCNLLYDFYDKSCFSFEHLDIKKVFFCDKNALLFKLQWKIMKKS